MEQPENVWCISYGFSTYVSLFYAGGKNNSLAETPVNMDLNTSVMQAHSAEDRTSLVGKPLGRASPKHSNQVV